MLIVGLARLTSFKHLLLACISYFITVGFGEWFNEAHLWV